MKYSVTSMRNFNVKITINFRKMLFYNKIDNITAITRKLEKAMTKHLPHISETRKCPVKQRL